MTRRRLLWILVVVGVLLAAHGLLWFAVVNRVRSGFAEWAAVQGGQGWTIASGPHRLGGWPLAAALEVADLHISGGASAIPGGLDWSASLVTLGVSMRHPTQLTVTAHGPQSLRLGPAPAIPYSAETLTAGLTRGRTEVVVTGLRAMFPAGALAVARLRLNLDAAAQSIVLSTEAIDLPPLGWALGERIASLELDAGLTGTAPPRADPAAWRDGGGTIVVRRLDMQWGKLRLYASATLGLDTALQPSGSATARLIDPAATVDALAAGGALPPSTARAAKAVLTLLSHIPESGGLPEVEAPLTLQNRRLAFAGFPFLVLPEIVWPKPP